MATHNTHRAAGRAVTPIVSANRAARGVAGTAALGTVLVGSAIAGTAAQAAPATTTAPAAPVAAEAAPATPVASVALSSTEKLRFGSRGDAVKDLQEALNDNGSNLSVDGVFGPKTLSSVKSYQGSAGLAVDGVVGPNTRAALNGGVSTSGASASSSSSSSSSSSIVDRARSAKGTPYSWGGSSLSGMDCSGLVKYAYEGTGISLPRTSSGLAAGGTRISQSEAQPGDIVVWPGHAAIYAGNNTIIDASGSKQKVVERQIWGNPTFRSYR